MGVGASASCSPQARLPHRHLIAWTPAPGGFSVFPSVAQLPRIRVERWRGALKWSHPPLGFRPCVWSPRGQNAAGFRDGASGVGGLSCRQPLLFPCLRKASRQRPLLNLLNISKAYDGFSFEKPKISQVLLFEIFFFPQVYEGFLFLEVQREGKSPQRFSRLKHPI